VTEDTQCRTPDTDNKDVEDVNREIMEEIGEYQENTHRSEEDGWFYSDDDGLNE